MRLEIDTRYSPVSQMHRYTNEIFAQKIKEYVESSPRQSGYCLFQNPSFPIQNSKSCGSNNNIGWIINFHFNDPQQSTIEMDFGTDFGRGSAVFVDGVYLTAFQADFWWDFNWNSSGVFSFRFDFTPGQHHVEIFGMEDCCDGPMYIQFSRNGQPKKLLTQDNFSCQMSNTNCTPLSCSEGQFQNGFICEQCSYRCTQCQKGAENCYKCSDPSRRLVDQKCICKDKYYDIQNDPICHPCHTSCKTCSSNQKCDTCEEDQYLDTNCFDCSSKYGPNCGKCTEENCTLCSNDPSFLVPDCSSQSCNSDEYQVGNECIKCSDNCVQCATFAVCTECMDDEYLLSGTCTKCTDTYEANCGTCNQFQCLTCKNDSTFILPDCIKNSCEIGEVQQGFYCTQCESDCEECSDPTTCTICRNGTYLEAGDCNLCPSPCSKCTKEECLECSQKNYIIETGCIDCIDHHFKNDQNLCLPCEQFYGVKCGTCNQSSCLTCKNNPVFLLPFCTHDSCPEKYYQENQECKPCIPNCLECDNGTECKTCIDLMYSDKSGQCKSCQSPCFLCESETICLLCEKYGFKPPNCTGCAQNFYSWDNECVRACPVGFYGNNKTGSCERCSNSCIDCEGDGYLCTKCPNQKILYQGKCVNCEDLLGMEQDPNQPIGKCREICGDGILLPTTVHQCDDSNINDFDGCSSSCMVEEGWICSYSPTAEQSICYDRRPIGFKVDFMDEKDQYLNIDQQDPIKIQISFNKTFSLPENTELQDYIQLKMGNGEKQIKIKELKVKKLLNKKSKRNLEIFESSPIYEIDLYPEQTLKERQIQIDLYPRQAFLDNKGNTLVKEDQIHKKINEYYYYTEKNRNSTDKFIFGIKLGLIFLILMSPFYAFIYRNHLNKFYAIFFIIDLSQTLYFYRFLNIRWPINGIKFFAQLKPITEFYMPNFFEIEIQPQEFINYSTGLLKFDKENISALFLNNTGSIMMYLLILMLFYLFVLLLSQNFCIKKEKLPKFHSIIYQLRHGYLECGIGFDLLIGSSGVLVIYTFLQLTNSYDVINLLTAIFFGTIYMTSFIFCLFYLNKNQYDLYCPEKHENENEEETKLQEKLDKIPTFKFRNIWHFIYDIQTSPKKSYFYFYFILRKIYLAFVLLSFQNFPKLQLLMCSFSHFLVIIILIKYRIFRERVRDFQLILSELLAFIGVGSMFHLLQDTSENEQDRFQYCWIGLSFLGLSLFMHGLFFLFLEIILPIIQYFCYKRRGMKIISLRKYRKEGKMSMILSQNALTLNTEDNLVHTEQSIKNNDDTNNNINMGMSSQSPNKMTMSSSPIKMTTSKSYPRKSFNLQKSARRSQLFNSIDEIVNEEESQDGKSDAISNHHKHKIKDLEHKQIQNDKSLDISDLSGMKDLTPKDKFSYRQGDQKDKGFQDFSDHNAQFQLQSQQAILNDMNGNNNNNENDDENMGETDAYVSKVKKRKSKRLSHADFGKTKKQKIKEEKELQRLSSLYLPRRQTTLKE